jgi:DNA (cytosine-5)-methyltransferase 1
MKARAEQGQAFPADQWQKRSSGLWVPSHLPRKRYAGPIAIDLFCGAGGFSLGVMQAGFQVVASLDNDPAAMHTYLHNLGSYPVNIHFASEADQQRAERYFEKWARKRGEVLMTDLSGGNWEYLRSSQGFTVGPVEHFFFGDVRKFTGQRILEAIGLERGDVDLVVGGPPCQGFSRAGKQDVMDPRNSLVFDFARLVLDIWPKCMVMENVPDIARMVTPEGLPVVDAFCRVLEDGGFGTVDLLKKTLLSSAGVGAALKARPPSGADDEEEDEEAPAVEQMALL